MGALKLLSSKQGIYIGIALLLFSGGVTSLYYIKYRPVFGKQNLEMLNVIIVDFLSFAKKLKSIIFAHFLHFQLAVPNLRIKFVQQKEKNIQCLIF